MITVYGIPNCSTVKKARVWLEAHSVPYRFHDYKKEGASPSLLRSWAASLGWEALLNTRGTTWRALDQTQREGVDLARALDLMEAKPSLIKRPLIDLGGTYLLGFDAAEYARVLSAKGEDA